MTGFGGAYFVAPAVVFGRAGVRLRAPDRLHIDTAASHRTSL